MSAPKRKPGRPRVKPLPPEPNPKAKKKRRKPDKPPIVFKPKMVGTKKQPPKKLLDPNTNPRTMTSHDPRAFNWEKWVEKRLPEIAEMFKIGCTIDEVVGVLGLKTYHALQNAFPKVAGMSLGEFQAMHFAHAKMSLRRLQLKSAEGEKASSGKYYIVNPSVQMQIWLGKNILGQTEKVEQTFTAPPAPFTITLSNPNQQNEPSND